MNKTQQKSTIRLFEAVLHAHSAHPLYEYSMAPQDRRPEGKGWRWLEHRSARGQLSYLPRSIWARRSVHDADILRSMQIPQFYLAVMEGVLHKHRIHPHYTYVLLTISRRVAGEKHPRCVYPSGHGWELNQGGQAIKASSDGLAIHLRRPLAQYGPCWMVEVDQLPHKEHLKQVRQWDRQEKLRQTEQGMAPMLPTHVDIEIDLSMGRMPPSELTTLVTGDPGLHFPGPGEVYTTDLPIWWIEEGKLVIQLHRYAPKTA